MTQTKTEPLRRANSKETSAFHTALSTFGMVLTLIVTSSACSDDPNCPPGTVRAGGACVSEGMDGGLDSGPEDVRVDSGPDFGCDGVDEDGLLDESSVREGDACEGACGTGVAQCVDGELECNAEVDEVCDGLDNDCDGQTDEGVVQTFYRDDDGDLFGGATCLACSIDACPAGSVEVGGDCDDSDASSYPGGEEVCDGADNNCDGNTDEGVQSEYFLDADGDGFGAGTACLACSAEACGATYVDNDEDCDDTCTTCAPGRSEETCDGLDDDCDGDVDESLQVLGYLDEDGDGQGVGTSRTMVCPDQSAARGGDCHDQNPDVFDLQTVSFETAYTSTSGTRSFDYNCDGVETTEFARCPECTQDGHHYCMAADGDCGMGVAVHPINRRLVVGAPGDPVTRICEEPSGVVDVIPVRCR